MWGAVLFAIENSSEKLHVSSPHENESNSNLAQVFLKVKERLSCSVEHELSSEAAIVSRLVYRNSTQHKGAVFFGKMKTTFSRLKTFLSQLSKLRGILLESMGRIKLSRLVDLTMLIIKTAVSAKQLASSCEDTYNVSMSQLAQVIYRWEYFVS
mmetsp:Transcript_6549/g.16258  ORF Transcript_6549/g.16258 Transcript_6549/m.16258 type:complete len:154 (-) Transcript_6549:269-730(-)